MIKYVEGDITQTTADALIHGVAPMDDFKQGLALSLRESWPALYKDFRHYCHQTSPKEGGLWTWKGPNTPFIVNLFTQAPAPSGNSHPGKATLPNLNHCFHALEKELKEREIKSLAITKLATGVGGLDWDEVKGLMESTFKSWDVPVYVYESFKKGVKAEES